LINQVVATNNILLTITNAKAGLGPITPAGISLLAVRGFKLSKRLSIHLLKPIAALRAKTIHKSMSPKSLGSKLYPSLNIARQKPIKAKGKANTVWLNLISDK
jgi:hypothetical protein